MDLSVNETLQCLDELQIPQELRERCRTLSEAGRYEELYRDLRCARTQFLEDMHTAQERLDRLDRLLYDIKKKREEA